MHWNPKYFCKLLIRNKVYIIKLEITITGILARKCCMKGPGWETYIFLPTTAKINWQWACSGNREHTHSLFGGNCISKLAHIIVCSASCEQNPYTTWLHLTISGVSSPLSSDVHYLITWNSIMWKIANSLYLTPQIYNMLTVASRALSHGCLFTVLWT